MLIFFVIFLVKHAFFDAAEDDVVGSLLLGSLLLRYPNRKHEQYENGNEGRHLILQ